MRTTRARRWVPSVVAGVLSGCGLLILVTGSGIPMSAAGAAAGAATRSADPLGTLVIANLGLGYAVSSQGPLDPAPFAANSPDPTAAEAALTSLPASSATYERVWQADGGRNEVRDLLVRFPDVVRAMVFLRAAQHSLDSGQIVSSDPLPSIAGARRVTYFAAADQDGVGEAVTMRAGRYVDLLSFFSAASGDARPVSPANAERVAQAQHAAMVAAPGGATATGRAGTTKGVSAGTIGFAVLVAAVLAAAVATPAFLRRRHGGPGPAATTGATTAATTTAATTQRGEPSGGDAIDDRREHSG